MSENSDDNSPIEVVFVDEDEVPLNSGGWGYVQRLSDEEIDRDLVQTSSESEILMMWSLRQEIYEQDCKMVLQTTSGRKMLLSRWI